ncbi:HAD family hydrolase [Alteromonas lipotrueiana]|uniref:HAD family hydrolase n=1 Tax=Alteromonas lipotrueiana TaxID=2803815 RepID=UPI001C47770D|nr:HAD-IA family hydrolase [Alteromonas lipotrueiana]
MNSTIDMVIFDCDGVLIDSEVLSLKAWQNVLEPRQCALTAAYFNEHFLGKSLQHVLERLKIDFSLVLTQTDVDVFYRELQQLFSDHLQPMPGIKTVLSGLKVPYCLATSSSPERTKFALEATGLSTYFTNNRFTRDEVVHGKPAPDLFLHAARKMNVTPGNCLVIEDSAAGLQAAQSANMAYLHYTGGSHLRDLEHTGTHNLASWEAFKPSYAYLFKSN